MLCLPTFTITNTGQIKKQCSYLLHSVWDTWNSFDNLPHLIKFNGNWSTVRLSTTGIVQCFPQNYIVSIAVAAEGQADEGWLFWFPSEQANSTLMCTWITGTQRGQVLVYSKSRNSYCDAKFCLSAVHIKNLMDFFYTPTDVAGSHLVLPMTTTTDGSIC